MGKLFKKMLTTTSSSCKSRHHSFINRKLRLLKLHKKIRKLKHSKAHLPSLPKSPQKSPSIEIEEESQNEETKVQETPATLSKFWRTSYELPAIYTGGKVLFSNKRRLFFSIGNFNLFVFDYEKRETVKKIVHENEEISNFAVNGLENMLITFTKNYLLRIIDLQSFEISKTIKVGDNSFALDLVFDPSGRFLALGTPQGVVKVFDVKKGTQTHEFKGHRGSIKQIFFHPESQKYQILSISEEGTIKIFDLVANACLFTNNTDISFTTLSVSEDFSRLFASENLTIYEYSLPKAQLISSFPVPEEFLSMQCIKVNNEEFLICGGESGILKIMNLSEKSRVFIEEKEIKTPNIVSISGFKGKNKLGVVTGEQNIMILETKAIESKLLLKAVDEIVGYNDEIIDLKFVRSSKEKNKGNNKQRIIMATNSSLIKIFDKKEKKFTLFPAHSDSILSLDAIDDLLLTASKDKTIRLWKFSDKKANYQLIATFTGHLESVGCVALAPKTTSFFLSGSVDKSIKVWSVKQAMKTLQKASKMSKKKEDIEITSAMRTIYAHEKDINALKFSPNEKFFASASQDKTIKVWDSSSFSAKLILKGHRRGVWDISFSPLEKLLASASGDGTVKVWNLTDGSCLSSLEGHNGSVLKVNWLCFGLELISGGSDGLIKLWNYKKGICINTLEKHEGKIWSLDVSEQSTKEKQEIISGANDSLFCIWEDITVEEEMKIQEESHKNLIEQQNIANALRNKDYYEAGRIAFKNGMVKNFQMALEFLFNEVEFKDEILYSELEAAPKSIEKSEEILKFEEKFTAFINEILGIDANKLLLFIRDMNSTSKHANLAQRTLFFVFKVIKVEKFVEFRRNFEEKDRKGKGKGEGNTSQKKKFDELIDVLIAYSEKHLARTQNFIKKSFYLDFMLKKLNLFNSDPEIIS